MRCIIMDRTAYTTVGTVSPSPLLRSLVDLNMGNRKVGGIKSLGVGVGLCVAEETEKELGGLFRPTCSRDTELLTCK